MKKESTEEELKNKIAKLEEEVASLKRSKNSAKSIAHALKNQAELDFVCPYYRDYKNQGWMRSSTYETDFRHIRKMAMSAINKVGSNNQFAEQKVKELSDKDFKIAVECAEELISVLAKYKKQYLESEGREDIITAFNI